MAVSRALSTSFWEVRQGEDQETYAGGPLVSSSDCVFLLRRLFVLFSPRNEGVCNDNCGDGRFTVFVKVNWG